MSRTAFDKSELPKYVQLASRLKGQIASGQLLPKSRVPSFPQLRGQFGISQNTVEKAHALLEQEGLIERRRGLGTFVTARERRAPTGVLGCYDLGPGCQHLPFYAHLLRGVQDAAHRAGREVLLLNPDAPSLKWEKIDGLLVYGENGTVLDSLPPGMRCVSMLDESYNFSSVVADDRQGMRLATEHLLALGHRKIAYLHENDPMTKARRGGYETALKKAGIKPQAAWLRNLVPHHVEEFRGRGRETMRAWLRGNWSTLGCTALLCQNDRTALGVLEALREAKIKVPDELSIVGFDSTDECDAASPRLTSVQVPLEKIGQAACELLLRELDAEPNANLKKTILVLPTGLCKRDSTAPPSKRQKFMPGGA